MPPKKITHKVLSVTILLLLAIFSGLVLGDYFYYRQRFFPGYYLEKFPLGDLTKEKAFLFLTTHDIEKRYLFPRTFTYKNKEYPFLPSEAGLTPFVKDSLEGAFASSYNKSYIGSLLFRFHSKKAVFPLRFKIGAQEKMEMFLAGVDRKVKNPYCYPTFIVSAEGTVLLKPAEPRRALDTMATIRNLEKNIAIGKTLIPLVLRQKKPLRRPSFGLKDLKRIPRPTLLGSYTTYFGAHNTLNRVHNIILGARLVDDILLLPGETFSFLKRMGEATPRRGFRPAPVVFGQGLTLEYGGGICQIATTLYNAAALADLDILSRTNHAIYFHIYPLGRDAAVYSPTIDLRFKNNTGAPILIASKTTKRSLTFQIFGRATGKKVSFSSPKVTKVGEKAFSALVTRTVSRYGRVIKRENLQSFYKLDGDKEQVKPQL